VGFDGRKMSKSLHNGIDLTDDDDTVVGKVRSARTDSIRTITFDPQSRPEVATLIQLAALCRGVPPQTIADEIGDSGAARLKAVVIDAVLDFLRPIRRRRADFDGADVADVLRRGVARAEEVATETLAQVHEAMGTCYHGGTPLPLAPAR
jgi:tryptophanyl-tRNA synthetase